MKKIIISLLYLLLFSVIHSNANTDTKDTTAKEINANNNAGTITKATCDSCSQIHQACFNCGVKRHTLSVENLIAFSPIIIYLIFLILMRAYLYRAGFRLADALTENIPVELTKVNTNPETATINPVVTTKELPKSTSRLIVFISSFMAITVGVCFCTYYMYIFFVTGCAPDLEHLTNVLLSLGLGVVPYAINKISSAFKLQ